MRQNISHPMQFSLKTMRSAFKPLLYALGLLALLLVFYGKQDNEVLEQEDCTEVQGSYSDTEDLIPESTASYQGQITTHHQKHHHIVRRRNSSEVFLKNPFQFSSATNVVSGDPLNGQSLHATTSLLRPSYYIFLFLFALF